MNGLQQPILRRITHSLVYVAIALGMMGNVAVAATEKSITVRQDGIGFYISYRCYTGDPVRTSLRRALAQERLGCDQAHVRRGERSHPGVRADRSQETRFPQGRIELAYRILRALPERAHDVCRRPGGKPEKCRLQRQVPQLLVATRRE